MLWVRTPGVGKGNGDKRENRSNPPTAAVDLGHLIMARHEGALEKIAIEMGHKLMRMSHSRIIASQGFRAALTDAEGRQSCQCKMSTP